MSKRFQLAYNALVDAYHNDTLVPKSCKGCACTNIIRVALGANLEEFKKFQEVYSTEINTSVESIKNHRFTQWAYSPTRLKHEHACYNLAIPGYDERILELTGYTAQEFWEIEQVFEANTSCGFDYMVGRIDREKDLMDGMMAVVDLLIKLDDIQEAETLKNNFKENKKLELC